MSARAERIPDIWGRFCLRVGGFRTGGDGSVYITMLLEEYGCLCVYDFRNSCRKSNGPQTRMDARAVFTTLITCLRL